MVALLLNALPKLLLLLAFLGSILALIIGIGVEAGSILHWLVPSIDLGTASLCGLLSLGILILTGFQTVGSVRTFRVSDDVDDEEDDDVFDQSVLSEDQVDTLADHLTEAVLTRVRAASEWQHASTKRRR